MSFFDEIRTSWGRKKTKNLQDIAAGNQAKRVFFGGIMQIIYEKLLSSLQVQENRIMRYQDYDAMSQYPEIARALKLYSDNSVIEGLNGKVINIEDTTPEIEKEWNTFYQKIDMENFLWTTAFNLVKYGDCIYEIITKENEGIVGISYVPASLIDIEILEDKVQYVQNLTNERIVVDADSIVHFKLLGDNINAIWGTSILEDIRYIWKRFMLIEDAMILHALVRTVPRLVFKIWTGPVPPVKAFEMLNDIRSTIQQRPIIDQHGRINLSMALISILDDIWIPITGEGDSSTVEALSPPEVPFKDIYEIFERKLYIALGIPPGYMRNEETAAKLLAFQNAVFGKTIERVQRALLRGVKKIFLTHLRSLNIKEPQFSLTMPRPSKTYVDTLIEIESAKAEMAAKLLELFPKDEVLKKYWGMKVSGKKSSEEKGEEKKLF